MDVKKKIGMLPCPFCGEKERFTTYIDHFDKWGNVLCGGCLATGPDVRTNYDTSNNAPWINEAISEWNTRNGCKKANQTHPGRA